MTNVVRKVVGSPKPPPDPDPEVSEAITRREQRAVEDERRQKELLPRGPDRVVEVNHN